MYLKLDKITKRYEQKTAVDALSLDIPRGVIYGMIGPLENYNPDYNQLEIIYMNVTSVFRRQDYENIKKKDTFGQISFDSSCHWSILQKDQRKDSLLRK